MTTLDGKTPRAVERVAVHGGEPDLGDRLLSRRSTCLVIGGVSTMTLHRHRQSRDFPQPDAIIAGRPFWRESRVWKWIDRHAPKNGATESAEENR